MTDPQQALDAWARWCRGSPRAPRTAPGCRPPGQGAHQGPGQAAQLAMRVEQAVRVLPELEREALRAHYVHRAHPSVLARRLRKIAGRQEDAGQVLRRAEAELSRVIRGA